jgi:hypothetical protein
MFLAFFRPCIINPMSAPGTDHSERSHLLRFGTFELDLSSEELRRGGALIKLQSQHFQLLALLAECAGQVVTRQEIRETLWDNQTFVDFDRSINLGINQIRERWTTIRATRVTWKRCRARGIASLLRWLDQELTRLTPKRRVISRRSRNPSREVRCFPSETCSREAGP